MLNKYDIGYSTSLIYFLAIFSKSYLHRQIGWLEFVANYTDFEADINISHQRHNCKKYKNFGHTQCNFFY